MESSRPTGYRVSQRSHDCYYASKGLGGVLVVGHFRHNAFVGPNVAVNSCLNMINEMVVSSLTGHKDTARVAGLRTLLLK